MSSENIVVGFDGTPESIDALVLTKKLVQVTGAEPHLVSVLPSRYVASETGDHRVAAADYFKAMLEIAKPILGADFTTHALDDCSVGAGLTAVAEAVKARTVVIGSSRRGPIGRVLMGDVGTRLGQGLVCEILVAPRGFADRGEINFEKIGIGYGGTPQCEAALSRGVEIARQFGSEATLIGVVPLFHPGGRIGHTAPGFQKAVESDMRKILERAVEEARFPLQIRIETGDVADGLAFASEDYDLMVVGSRGYGPVGRVMIGSTSAGLSRSSASPVLIVPRR